MSMMKPREWWIDDYNGNAYAIKTADFINVIEKSAYDKSIAALKRISEERASYDALMAFSNVRFAQDVLKELGEQE